MDEIHIIFEIRQYNKYYLIYRYFNAALLFSVGA